MAVNKSRVRAGRVLLIILICIITFVYLVPILFVIDTSFKPWSVIKEWPPKIIFKPTIAPYIRIFTNRSYNESFKPTAEEISQMSWYAKIVYKESGETILRVSDFTSRYKNSVIITLVSTALTILLGTLAAYAFSRFKMKGKDDLLFFILSTRMLPAVVVLIPIFLMFRKLGLGDTHFGLILLYTAFNLSFAVWVLKGFIDEIPVEYEEAALVDGYTRFQTFWKIIVPQARTGIAATAVFCFIFAWNEYGFAFIMSKSKAQTIPPWLTTQMGVLGYDWGAAAAGTFLFIIPALVFTILLRKSLVRGITFGAIRK